MHIKNFEFKVKTDNTAIYENKLLTLNPVFHGTDLQTDTYFNAPYGRLKLREGNIENALIQYSRENAATARQSDVILYKHQPDAALKNILIQQLGILVIVSKQRKIYFIDNVKFHFDIVDQLGYFVEVEAADDNDLYTTEQLAAQCKYYFNFFEFTTEQMMDQSYSDLLLHLNQKDL